MTNENIHDRFEDVKHRPLRVFNRTVMMLNLNSISKEEATKYASTFTASERMEMGMVLAHIKEKGQDETRKIVTKGLEVVDD